MSSSSWEPIAAALYKDNFATRKRRWGKLYECILCPGKNKASPAALGWFSPMASSWQLMTARKLRELDPFSLPQASAPSNPKTQVYGGRKIFSCTDTQDARQREAYGMHSPMDLVSQKAWPGLSRGLINSGSSGLENVHFMHWSAWPRVKRGPGKP